MHISAQKQSGYALMLMVLALMGLGGGVLAGFTQQARQDAEDERFLHNQRVLEEAKHALLMYAYNYPWDNPGRGPGRLPCPDTLNNDGNPDPQPDCIDGGGAALVGRFPWNDPDLNFYDARDASGERLWYAVSANFANIIAGLDEINSSTTGTITLLDQSGSVIYDGNGAGIAAIIIAPGSITRRDQNNDGTYEFVQLRNTAAQRLDPRNYLDTLHVPAAGVNGQIDNAQFNNGESDSNDDGFIMGPIFDVTQSSFVVNDQVIVITADEVVDMAERATLQIYRDAINDYIANVGVTAYPWLDDYSTTDLTVFDGDVGTRIGRLPSIFSDYFAPSPQASESIISDVDMRVVTTLTVNGFPVPLINPGVISSGASISFNAAGDLSIDPAVNGGSIARYYWDEEAAPDGWQECLPVVTGTEQDCNQATANPGVPDSSIVPNQLETRVVRVTYNFNFVAGNVFVRNFADNSSPNPVYQAPTAAEHARVYLNYSENFADAVGVDFKYDNFYQSSFDDVVLGSVDYQLGVVYYPELPDWPLDNDWHNSVQISYAAGFQPGAVASCTAGTDCITVNNVGGATDDKNAVLVLASDHGIEPDDGLAGYQDDLAEIFDLPHRESTGTEDDDFDARPANGNDEILIIN